MNSPEKKIVFAGQFEIGEKITSTQKEIVKAGLKLSAKSEIDLSILFGDIGVAQKLEAYIKREVSGVKEIYFKRMDTALTGCVRAQLPSKEELDKVIDSNQLQKAFDILSKTEPNIVQLYPKTHELVLKNAQELFDALRKEFPSDPRWQLKFEYKFYD